MLHLLVHIALRAFENFPLLVLFFVAIISGVHTRANFLSGRLFPLPFPFSACKTNIFLENLYGATEHLMDLCQNTLLMPASKITY